MSGEIGITESQNLVMEILMNENVNGIVLKQSDYKENAVILSVLTKEYGKISLVANGVKKMNSKNASAILPCTFASFTFDYKEGKNIFRMKTAITRKLFRKMRDDLVLSAAANVLIEVCEKMCYEESDMFFIENAYDSLLMSLEYLDLNMKSDAVLAIYIANMMNAYGVSPNVDECAICSSKKVSAISVQDGGFLCLDCAKKENITCLHFGRLKQFRLINKAKVEHLEIAMQYIENTKSDIQSLLEILKVHTGIEIRSFAFYERLIPLNEAT